MLDKSKKAIRQLCDQYGFKYYIEGSEELLPSVERLCFRIEIEYPDFPRPYTYAKMIDFLRSVKGEISISGIVANPREGLPPKSQFSIKIDDDGFLEELHDFLNERLYEVEEIGLLPGCEGFWDSDRDEYSEEGLSIILQNQENLATREKKLSQQIRKGRVLHSIYNALEKDNVFEIGSTQRKKYCFLYDLLVMNQLEIDMGMYVCQGSTAKKKADKIKYYMETYEIHCKNVREQN